MSRVKILALLLVLLCTSGCIQTKRQKLYAARETFNATVNVLASGIEAKRFTPEQSKDILMYAESAQRLLDQYDAAVELNQPLSVFVSQFNSILLEIVAYKVQMERTGQ